ncbi:MAG: hypothetical protein CML15_02605 [Puniceicoccaceae bacterium]|nr:hypothetical protein [Puniceicoccaceae bacterium]
MCLKQARYAMSIPFCPYLPPPEPEMSYRSLRELRGGNIETFYRTALAYGHYLWLKGCSGRAILAITRALYADLPEQAAVLREWPLPYRALHWIVVNHPNQDFPGNPRISFQHQATRLRGDRATLRRARAWAVWKLICSAKPELVADNSQGIKELTLEEIEQGIAKHGHLNEVQIWQLAFRLS